MEEDLTELLTPVANGRRYWVRAPQSAERPFLVMNVIDAPPAYHMRGPSGYTAYRVQIDCYADTYTAAKAESRSVRAILSGNVGGKIQGIFIEGQRDLPAADAGDVNSLFRTSIDATIHYGENP